MDQLNTSSVQPKELHEEGPFPQIHQTEFFASQLFWLVITFTLLYMLMSKIALPRVGDVIQGRRDKIASDLERAETLSSEAETIEADYLKRMQEIREEANALMQSANNEANKEAEKRHAELDAVLNKQMAEADTKINASRESALDEVADISSEMARNIAQKIASVKVAKKAADASVKKELEKKAA